jgi:hypothetical protein
VKVITNQRSEKLEMEVKCLYDDVMTLRMAIEEAIIKGQKSWGDLADTPGSGLVFNGDLALTCVNAGSGVVGWVDDF